MQSAAPKTWTKELIETAVADFMEKNNRYPNIDDLRKKNGLPNRLIFERVMGQSLVAYGDKHYPELMQKSRQTSYQAISQTKRLFRDSDFYGLLLAVQNFYMEHGRMPVPDDYTVENGLPSYAVFKKYAEQILNDDLEVGIRTANKSKSKPSRSGDAR